MFSPHYCDVLSCFSFLILQAFVCDWRTRADDITKVTEVLANQLAHSPRAVPSVQPFHSLAFPFSLAEMQQIAQRHALRAKMSVALCDTSFKYRAKPKSVRLKVGYVSSDFGNHPLSHLMSSVFGMHNTAKFEVYCYALSPSDRSHWRLKIEEDAEHFTEIGHLHASEAAQVINNDGIHILINLNGYTKGARNDIFALQPAPIQVRYVSVLYGRCIFVLFTYLLTYLLTYLKSIFVSF